MTPLPRLTLLASLTFALSTCATAQTPPANPKIHPLTPTQRSAMTGKSWKPECPVPLDDLAAVEVTYFGFDAQTHHGTLIVHKRFASDASKIFSELYAIHFPIHKVSPWENYGPDVYAEQDITVGFYCEKADDAPDEWSGHAYGVAIDLNPLENPFRDAKKGWWPKASIPLAPRDNVKGKVFPNSPAFNVFASHGWAWGGFYVGEPDYMHFYKLTVGGSGNVLERPYAATGLQYIPGGAMEAAQPK
jgi:D-alanyl-D-alanine carboxypeptidase